MNYYKISLHYLLITFSLSVLFHISVLFEWINYTIVWGGRIKTKEQMYQFESVSLFINILLLTFTFVCHRFQKKIPLLIRQLYFGGICILFTLNTVGNVFSKSTIEALVFTPLTFFSALSAGYIVVTIKKQVNHQ